MPDRKMSEHRWAMVGKVVTALVTVITFAGGLVYLYDRFTSSASLTVMLSSTEYLVPPVITAPRDEANIAQEDNHDFKELPAALPRYDGYFSVKIENTGGAQADDVKFVFPYAGVAQVFSKLEPIRSIEFSQSIAIGSIPPSQTVMIRAWTDSEPRDYSKRDIKVTHTKGVEDVIFLHETDGFWRTLGRAVFGILKLVFVAILALVGINSLAYLISRPTRVQKKPDEVRVTSKSDKPTDE